MPQFDIYVWASVGFWTILVFHFFYFCTIRYLIAPIAEMEKAAQKICVEHNPPAAKFSVVDVCFSLYL